jgi:hypothetical protein
VTRRVNRATDSRFPIKAIESLIIMKDFAGPAAQTLNCRQEKPVDGSNPNRNLDPTSPTFDEGSFCHD